MENIYQKLFMTEYCNPSPAGFLPRFLAFVIDVTAIFGIMGMAILFLIASNMIRIALDIHYSRNFVISHAIDDTILSLEPALQTPSGITAAALFLILLKYFILIITPVYILYSACYDASAKQATPGKTAMHIIVTSQDGRPIGILRSFCRTIAKILCILPCGIGMLPLLFSHQGRGLHDYGTGTRVMNGLPDLHDDPDALSRPDKIFAGILLLFLLILQFKRIFML
jgi:uncharacterized RDD family membrane protein YckC